MDKGFSSSRDPRNRRQAPKTIANGPRPDEEFNDQSRDPRLNHDKYREKIMNKSRISPDTTVSFIYSKMQCLYPHAVFLTLGDIH